MRKNAVKKVFIVLVIFLACLYVVLPPVVPTYQLSSIKTPEIYKPSFQIGPVSVSNSYELPLGLDLAGGSQLTFEADTSSIPEESKSQALESTRLVIEKRVNFFGVSEPTVQLTSFEGKDRILVELPGVKDIDSAVNLIGQTAKLEFATFPEEATESATLTPTGLTGAMLEYAQVNFNPTTGKPAVGIKFNQEGSELFEKVTSENLGKPIAIFLDDDIISAPVVQETIAGGTAQISGEFTTDEAKRLASQLNAGALPVTINLVQQRTIGATLGIDSINKSIVAGVVGIGMVFLFMFLNYGRFGVISGIALVIYAVITLALYKIIPVVLTLPGIAGFLLSVGMAVDSNILIFERYKEEIVKRPTLEALEIAFGRAWDSIRDANIATLITAFILANPLDWNFLHISGPVRGFAITLALGIGISLFTGIFVTRNLLRLTTPDKALPTLKIK